MTTQIYSTDRPTDVYENHEKHLSGCKLILKVTDILNDVCWKTLGKSYTEKLYD